MNNPVLSLRDVRKTYAGGALAVEVLRGVSLEVAAGEVAALVGHSGSGKTTLLQIAGLLDAPTGGQVMVAGQDAQGQSDAARTALRGKSIGFVYQFHHLLPEFSALENVMMPLLLARESKAQAKEKALGLLESVGLSHRAAHRPAELSGGEQQRTAIARALVHSPALLLADEPTGNLDDVNAGAVFDLLLKLARERRMAALIVTHNRDLAARMDRTFSLKGGLIA